MAADSVAVNQPKILPPTMMNGVISAGTDTSGRGEHLAQRGARVGRVAAPLGVGVHGGHLRQADQQARDDAGQHQRADRHRSTPPQTIIRIDGGMITAITADTAVMATEKLTS